MQLRVLNLLGRDLTKEELSVITAEEIPDFITSLIRIGQAAQSSQEMVRRAFDIREAVEAICDEDPNRIGAVLVFDESNKFFSYLNDMLADIGILPVTFVEYENGGIYLAELFDRDCVMVARGFRRARKLAKEQESSQP